MNVLGPTMCNGVDSVVPSPTGAIQVCLAHSRCHILATIRNIGNSLKALKRLVGGTPMVAISNPKPLTQSLVCLSTHSTHNSSQSKMEGCSYQERYI